MIELRGAGFHNKGAELMLYATVQALRQRIPDVQLAVEPLVGSYLQRAALQLYQIFPSRRSYASDFFGLSFYLQSLADSALSWNLSRRLTRSYGCVLPHCLNALVDISGFAFTDQWGPRRTQSLATLSRAYKKAGNPVVFLPQAFGPFELPETRRAMKSVLHNADLVYARDIKSLTYLQDLNVNPEKIFLAPDITLTYASPKFDQVDQDQRFGCIIPNTRVLDQGAECWGESYLDLLIEAARAMLRKNLSVKVIVHDSSTGSDHELAHAVMTGLHDQRVSLCQDANAITLKHVIGRSYIVVGSRYHALVAAFSSAVPSLCISWSHKYEMLYDDFNCSDFIIQPGTTKQELNQKMEWVLEESTYAKYQDRVRGRLAQITHIHSEMWHNVCSLLQENIPS